VAARNSTQIDKSDNLRQWRVTIYCERLEIQYKWQFKANARLSSGSVNLQLSSSGIFNLKRVSEISVAVAI
jgi:hypothetical protein